MLSAIFGIAVGIIILVIWGLIALIKFIFQDRSKWDYSLLEPKNLRYQLWDKMEAPL